MEHLVKQFVDYLHDNLDIKPGVQSSKISHTLPHYLAQDYTYYDAEILGKRYLLLLASSQMNISPSSLKKQWDKVSGMAEDVFPIYVFSSLSAFKRKRLIQQKVPFVVPGNQMYLPDLGIDLREYFRRHGKKRETLSPSAQHCLIHFLLNPDKIESTPSQLSNELNYSKMTMTRAIDELVIFQLGETRVEGKMRWFSLKRDNDDLWQRGIGYFKSPVSKEIWVNIPDLIRLNLPLAGESALSQLSDINPPRTPCYAVGRAKWKEMQKGNISISENPDPDDVQIQIWRYDPDLTASAGMVDHLSLYLSLREEVDDRVQGALEEAMRRYQWYQD